MEKTLTQMSSRIILGAFIVLSVGCSTFERSRQSGYESRDARGLGPAREVSEANEPATLKRAEKNLEGRREREQYFKNKPYLKNDHERLALLSLGSFEERARWLDAHGISANGTPHSPEMQALIDINDITLGMTKQAVRDSWGEPELVEVAGNPLYGNERWAYSEQLPSTEGFQTEKRIVYFEGGRVSGWNKR